MDRNHNEAIMKTIGMSANKDAQDLAAGHNLRVLDVTWEDTGRYKGSSVGPNISDMTLQILDSSGRPRCLPVVRAPNFSDRSVDLRMDAFGLLVGNERGEKLQKVSLDKYLGDLRAHLTDPGSWKGDGKSLLAEGKDVDVLVSAQACFLPIPGEGEAQFNPVLFNYQSTKTNPAVLAILVTREGTSATVIDNNRDKFPNASGGWGQRLFFNKKGERCSFTGKRLADFKGAGGDETTSASAAGQEGLNMVLLIQVPLKVPEQTRAMLLGGDDLEILTSGGPMRSMKSFSYRGVEDAVIGHGAAEGDFTEVGGFPIERDARFPVRVTVQFYKATEDGVVTAEDMAAISAQIERVYADAKYVGSLVTELDTGRSTEWDPKGAEKEPAGFWDGFWAKHLVETGKTPEQVKEELATLLGKDPSAATKDEILGAIGGLSRLGVVPATPAAG